VDAFAAEHGRLPDCRELAAALGLGSPAVYRYCKRFGVSLRRKRTRVRCTLEACVAAADAFAGEQWLIGVIRVLVAVLGLGSPAVYRYRKIYGVSIVRTRTSVR
jgi:predicted DNA-binding transcriptional regulator AlpA